MDKRIPSYLKGKGIARGFSPPPPCRRIRAPELDTSDLIQENSLTLIGRLTNPASQRLWALFPFLSNRWNLKGKAAGSDLGKGCFQFKFNYEEDLQSVLKNRPYHFDQWMVIIQKWEPIISDTFPSMIPFWIELQGLPKHYWQPKMLEAIGDDLGEIMDMEITSSSVKLRILLNGLNPLLKETVVEFSDGQEALVSLEYKNLKNHCLHCQRITHDQKTCPGLLPVAEDKTPAPHSQAVSSSLSKGNSKNYYTPQDNFAAPRTTSQGSARNYLPTREFSRRSNSSRNETRHTSASKSFPQRQSFQPSRPHRAVEYRERSHSKAHPTSSHLRGAPRHLTPSYSLQWREKTPSQSNPRECSDSSRPRRPPLERTSTSFDYTRSPPPIPAMVMKKVDFQNPPPPLP